MEYFWLRTDRSFDHGIEFQALSKDELTGKEPVIRQIQVSENRKETVFPDYLTTNTIRGQYHMISDRFKELSSVYLPRITEFMPFVLIDQFRDSHLYWFLIPTFCENCISNKTIYSFDQTVKDLVLYQERIPKESVFSVETKLQRLMIVKLDFAESLLRRGFYGLKLNQVALEE